MSYIAMSMMVEESNDENEQPPSKRFPDRFAGT